MKVRIFGINQSVLNVTHYIDEALWRLRKSNYSISTSCRFEMYKKRFLKNYVKSIINQQYDKIKNDYSEILQGYKDYWELLAIANSSSVLSCDDKKIRDEINSIFSGGILEGEADTKPWNYQFQYYLSSIFERSGFDVILEEPDFLFRHKGKEYAVAAKRLNGRSSIERNIKEAEYQIAKQNNYGFIALSLDKIYKNMNQVHTFNNPDKSIRLANELIQTIIKDQLKWKYFNERSPQILGIIAHIAFPYLLKSDKPLFELGYSAYLMFLPIEPPDSPEWNEVIDIGNRINKIDVRLV